MIQWLFHLVLIQMRFSCTCTDFCNRTNFTFFTLDSVAFCFVLFLVSYVCSAALYGRHETVHVCLLEKQQEVHSYRWASPSLHLRLPAAPSLSAGRSQIFGVFPFSLQPWTVHGHFGLNKAAFLCMNRGHVMSQSKDHSTVCILNGLEDCLWPFNTMLLDKTGPRLNDCQLWEITYIPPCATPPQPYSFCLLFWGCKQLPFMMRFLLCIHVLHELDQESPAPFTRGCPAATYTYTLVTSPVCKWLHLKLCAGGTAEGACTHASIYIQRGGWKGS